MPIYYDLLPESEIEENGHPRLLGEEMNTTTKKRAINKILHIKKYLKDSKVPDRRGDNLLLCNWNFKEFGQSYKHPEFYYYMAEIMAAFDMIVIQEIRRSIKELNIIKNLLGDNWFYIINDVTEGSEGNKERNAILYNSKRVVFNGFSGELVVPRGPQIKRTPHITGFLSDWKNFSIINVHLEPNRKSESVKLRYEELSKIMDVLEPKAKTGGLGYENIILSGDFNFYPGLDDDSINFLKEKGFYQVEKLKSIDTTLAINDFTYDRFFIKRDKYLSIVKDGDGNENSGVIDLRTLFEKDIYVYKEMAKEDYHRRNPTKTLSDNGYPGYFWVHWLSRQMSDHNPIWIEISTDSSEDYLKSKLNEM